MKKKPEFTRSQLAEEYLTGLAKEVFGLFTYGAKELGKAAEDMGAELTRGLTGDTKKKHRR